MASGVDTATSAPAPSDRRSGLPPRPRVIFTGRIHPRRTSRSSSTPGPRSPAGPTPPDPGRPGPGARPARRTRARALGVADRVHFLGAVDDPADLLRAADAFVLPSIAEGMSNSLLEAMATSLPCLASAIGGNTDLLQDGHDGLLVPPSDPSAWSSALLRVLERPHARPGLGAAARRRIEAEFSLTVVVDRYLALYRRMLAGTWPVSLGGRDQTSAISTSLGSADGRLRGARRSGRAGRPRSCRPGRSRWSGIGRGTSRSSAARGSCRPGGPRRRRSAGA